MARDTGIEADAHAPAATRILADFVATHPSKGWSDAVEREARRTLQNYVGCAVGASRHPTFEAALAATSELAPAPQATLFGRDERVDMASAAMLNGISSQHFRLRRHASADDHPSAGPVASAAFALAEHTGAGGARSSTRWSSVSTSRAGSATRSTRTTTIAVGTSPVPPECSAPRPPAHAFPASIASARRWRSESRRRSPSASARSSAR